MERRADMADIVIVASAYGTEAIRRDGHRAYVGRAAEAGAAGFEVRRELFAADEDCAPAALAALGMAIAAAGLWAVYSTPATLYREDGALDREALALSLREAEALGAHFLKFQLGGFAGTTHAAEIAAVAQGSRARILVENGQLAMGGTLAQFTALFAALVEEGAAGTLGMTFDIGNWLWPGELPLAAARALAPHVEYIHCKAVTGEGARRFAVAPQAADPLCLPVLATLPREVPRGVEFPFDPADLAADARRRVAWLETA